MAQVFRGTGTYLAKSKDIDLGPILDEIAHEIESFVIGGIAGHIETGELLGSVHTITDRSSPSGRDRFVYSDDPAVLSIEFGHDQVDQKGVSHGFVEGLHLFQHALDAVQFRP